MVVPEALAVAALVKVGHDVLDYAAPIQKYADSPRFYDLSQGFLAKPISIKKTAPRQFKAIYKSTYEDETAPKSRAKSESKNGLGHELVPLHINVNKNDIKESKYHSTRKQENEIRQNEATVHIHSSVREEKEDNNHIDTNVPKRNNIPIVQESETNQSDTIKSKFNLSREEGNSKLTFLQTGDNKQRREFIPGQESNQTSNDNRGTGSNFLDKPDLVENLFTDLKDKPKNNTRKASRKFYTFGGQKYFRVDVAPKRNIFIPIETRIILNETIVWTGDRYAKEVDSSIYNTQRSNNTDCLYIVKNGPGTCFLKSHEGFYLMKHTYFSKPFDCSSDSFNIRVKKTITFKKWETSFNSPLSTSQLVELIKPPLPPAPEVNRLSFDISCPGRGIKRVAFNPLYYKVRGISYNIKSKFDVSKGNSVFQDIHFPVLLASGIVHGIYTVLDY